MRNRFEPETDWRGVESFEIDETTDVKDWFSAVDMCEDEIKNREEITGAAVLNEATKKATVTEVAPPGLATHLRLNADRYNTYVQHEMAGTQLCQLEVAKTAHNHL